MDDRDIEALVEKYRPAEPPAALHDFIHQLATSPTHRFTTSTHQITNPPIHELTWPWAVAAGLFLAIAVVLHGRATAPTLQAPTPTASQLADDFGGGPAAMAVANFIVSSPLTAAGRDPDLSPANPQ